MQNNNDATQTDYSYFGIQSSWGVTKHFGGLRATDELATLCHIGVGKTVLVVGCGIGLTPCHLAKNYGCQIVGVDLSEKMVEWSLRRVERKGLAEQVELRVADAQKLPFNDSRFDAVLIESVNAFVPERQRAFAEYARVLRPGGYVGMNEGTWVKSSPPADLLQYIERVMGADFQTVDAWKALLVHAGLEVTTAKTYTIKALRQRLDEYAGMDGLDWVDRLRAVGSAFGAYLKDPKMRAYVRELMPSRQVMHDMFEYLGYGIFVGKKAM